LFDKSQTKLLKYPERKDGEIYTIPTTVKEIFKEAFMLAENLKQVIVPEGVEKIGANAFANCFDLKNVTFEGVVEKISPTAFEGCDRLANITFPEHVINFLNTIHNIKNKHI
jgi:hypothetical protein